MGVVIAADHLHPSFRTDGSDKELNTLLKNRHPWHRLTFVGSRIVLRVLAIPGVSSLSVRPDYFNLEVVSEECWRDVLTKVVEIIRDETDDVHARVVIKPGYDQTPIPQWHAALLEELFA